MSLGGPPSYTPYLLAIRRIYRDNARFVVRTPPPDRLECDSELVPDSDRGVLTWFPAFPAPEGLPIQDPTNSYSTRAIAIPGYLQLAKYEIIRNRYVVEVRCIPRELPAPFEAT